MQKLPRVNSLAILSFSLLLASCGKSALPAPVFYATYMPSDEVTDIDAIAACAQVGTLEFVDSRVQKESVGTRTYEESPQREAILAKGDLKSWLTAGVTHNLNAARIRQTPSSPIQLIVKMEDLQLSEVYFSNSEYKARIVLDVQIISPFKTTKLRYTGHGSNYGSAASEVNYQETINRALEDASQQMISGHEFSTALYEKPTE